MRLTLIAAGTAAAALFATPALADRLPTAIERGEIERALRDAGYVSWEEIELDDDGPYWEVDDARRADRSRWDLKLEPQTLAIIEIDRED